MFKSIFAKRTKTNAANKISFEFEKSNDLLIRRNGNSVHFQVITVEVSRPSTLIKATVKNLKNYTVTIPSENVEINLLDLLTSNFDPSFDVVKQFETMLDGLITDFQIDLDNLEALEYSIANKKIPCTISIS